MTDATISWIGTLQAVFNLFDLNQDGSITGEDFDLMGKRVCEQFGITVDSDNGRRLCEGYQAWWERLRGDLDVDSDSRIAMEEFAAIYRGDRGDPEEYFSGHVAQAARNVAEMLDGDGDGYIDQGEYLAFMGGFAGEQGAADGFQQLDTDGDGRVSVGEFQAGVQQVMTGNDPSAPGASMLGKHW